MPAGDLIVLSTRDSAFQGSEESEAETPLTSDEVRSSPDAIDFTLRPPPPKTPPAAPASTDEAATAVFEAREAASPKATVSRAAWGATNAAPPAGNEAEAATSTGPSAPAPGAAARGSGPVVCELVNVVLEPDPLDTDRGASAPDFQPMSLTIRGAERLAVVVEDGRLRRQIYSCLGGLDLPARGGVHLFGHDGAALGPDERRALRRGQIGLLHPDLPLLTALTVEENLRLALELAVEPHPRERLAELLDRFDLHHWRHRYPGECPVDVRIRSGLARALAPRPLCLVADLVEDTDEEERTLALVALGLGLESTRTTAIIILPLGEIPDWVDRGVQVSAAGMTELTRLDPVPASSHDDAASGADAASGDADIAPEATDGEADAAAAGLEEAA